MSFTIILFFIVPTNFKGYHISHSNKIYTFLHKHKNDKLKMSNTCTICQVSKVDAFQHLSILIQLFIYIQGEKVSKMLPQKKISGFS